MLDFTQVSIVLQILTIFPSQVFGSQTNHRPDQRAHRNHMDQQESISPLQ
ncbi:UNVERIFIED_CONTAM: hypothetical protein FKN15_017818 [Acipenser sinensis]